MKRLILSLILVCASFLSMAQYGRKHYNPYPVVTNGMVTALESMGDTLLFGGNFNYLGERTGPAVILDPDSMTRLSNDLDVTTDYWDGIEKVFPDGSGGWYLMRFFAGISNNLPTGGLLHINKDMTIDGGWLDLPSTRPDAFVIANGLIYISYSVNHWQNGWSYGIVCVDIATKTVVSNHGLTINGKVNAMAVRGDSVILAGEFTQVAGQPRNKLALVHANSQRLLNWNPSPLNGNINGMILEGNDLYIAGDFASAGSTSATNLARLNAVSGSIEQGYNTIVTNFLFKKDSILYCINASNSGSEKVNAVTGIRKSLPSLGNSNHLKSVAIVKNKLFVASDHDLNPGLGLLKWMDLNTDSLSTKGSIFSRELRTLAANDSVLLAAGNFTSMNGIIHGNLAALNGTSNQLLDFSYDGELQGSVTTIKHHNGRLYVGTKDAGSVVIMEARTGARITEFLAINGPVTDLTVTGNTLYFSGKFTEVSGQNRHGFAALDLVTGSVLPWNPGPLSPAVALGTKVIVRNNGILLAGTFDSLGGLKRPGIALVDPISGQLTPFTVNILGNVTHLETKGNTAYVAGYIRAIDGQPRYNAAAFDLSTGLSTTWNNLPDSMEVEVLQLHNNMVILGGPTKLFGGPNSGKLQGYDIFSGAQLPFVRDVTDGTFKIRAIRDRLYAGGIIWNVSRDYNAVGLMSMSDCVGHGKSDSKPVKYHSGCIGDVVSMNASVMGDSLIWSHGPSTGVSQVYVSGVYTVTGYRNGCEGIPEKHIVRLTPQPSTPVLTISGVNNNILTATPGSTSYAWYDGTRLMAKTYTNTYKASSSGRYSVIAYNNACASVASSAVTALEDLAEASTVKLYPNPASTTLNLHLPEGTLQHVAVLDFLGRQVQSQKLEGTTATLDIAHLPAGAYLCRISTDAGMVVKKVMVER